MLEPPADSVQRPDPRKCPCQAVLLRRGYSASHILQRRTGPQAHNTTSGNSTIGKHVLIHRIVVLTILILYSLKQRLKNAPGA